MTDKVKGYLERLGQLAEAIEAESWNLAENLAYHLATDIEGEALNQELDNEEAA